MRDLCQVPARENKATPKCIRSSSYFQGTPNQRGARPLDKCLFNGVRSKSRCCCRTHSYSITAQSVVHSRISIAWELARNPGLYDSSPDLLSQNVPFKQDPPPWRSVCTFKFEKHGPCKSVPLLLAGYCLHGSSWTD